MMTTNVELYEALKDQIGAEAARMIAEIVPPSRDLARREDLVSVAGDLRAEMAGLAVALRGEMAELTVALRGEMAELRTEVRTGLEGVRAEIHRSNVSTLRWMLTFAIPVWAGTWATVLAVVFRA